ncbi:hypothetical protein OAG1_27770 [Agarivorans sp. OAG1]|uniref:hypothetical protein n=1 Tax=Agarivorans sp. OAG1 TaxID=3082387 RepID=UPI002B291BAD|nr:hypothetical protein OAG1_27770 [Agarivorans sp. OAG1]
MDVINEIEHLVIKEMESAHSFYDSHVKGPRLSFRILGVTTLALSVIIPFISQDSLEIPNKLLWITGLSLSITLVTGISTFFKPDEIWKLNMGAKLNLEALFALWRLEYLEAKSSKDPDEAVKKCLIVSKRFLQSAQKITAANTEGFFANISLPETK